MLKQKILLSMSGILISFLLLEVGSRFLLGAPKREEDCIENRFSDPLILRERISSNISSKAIAKAALVTPENVNRMEEAAHLEGLDTTRRFSYLEKKGVECCRSIVSTKKSKTTIYDVRIHTDELGRRNVPRRRETAKGSSPLYFLGDSFVFGEGLEDKETIPNLVQENLPETSVFNLSYPGAAPNDVLHRIDRRNSTFLDKLPAPGGTALFLLLPFHIQRVACSLSAYFPPSKDYILNSEFFKLDPSGSLRSLGRCRDQKVRNYIYGLLAKSKALQVLYFRLPFQEEAEEKKIISALLREIKKRMEVRLKIKRFVVINFPRIYAHNLNGIEKSLVSAEIELLNLDQINLPKLTGGNCFIPGYDHPSKRTNIVLAEIISEYLKGNSIFENIE